MSGTLYVVATPIGNLGDLTPRAREVLASVALIAAEDTRHTRQLLQTCGIGTALTSLHEHNEGQKSAELVARLAGGDSIALVSDAGTPLVSDPGFDLVAAARREGIAVVAIPGACAAIAALSVAGLPTNRFVFEGFLPAKAAARGERLGQLAGEERTLIFYEAPHRLAEALRDMAATLGAERRASISRELTKRFETTYSGTLAELRAAAEHDSDMARGEIVIVVSGAPTAGTALDLNADSLLRALLQELPPSQAAKIAAHLTGGKRSELYEAALQIGRVAGEKKG
ncbi:MAG TPA: 16S rRNA (cytidine(1402)-2'-O)-methyltransferase [Steroidobacteraceae bacterium]|jgi:16S rRNA (cytidine1402-2'-O)-methyltransferase|nr:16S rRNA (cytidine(1402)-2'-O)-methyltransferase [Steroidobacteraceae bacterium]